VTINPALAELQPFVGQWRTELYNASFLPDVNTRATGSMLVEWIEDGSALIMRQGDFARPPAAAWIIGRDESESEYLVFYFDDRGVSRVYRMSLDDSQWKMWRHAPELTQRFTARLEPGAIRGCWEKSSDQGATWEHDFNIDYLRD
jgi:hypothetical protein